jgi:hypothetical protein
MPLLQPDGPDEVEQPFPQRGPGEPGQLLQRSGDQLADGVPPVQRRVRVLEDDLHALELLTAASGHIARQRRAVQ